MILALIGIVLAASFVVFPAVVLATIKKQGTPVVKPALMGALTWAMGMGIAVIPIVLLSYISRMSGGFMEDEAAFNFIASAATGLGMACAMAIMLKYFLKDRRSLPETIAYAMGLSFIPVIFRAYTVAMYELTLLGVEGLSYATSGLFLLVGVTVLVSTLMTGAVAMMLTWFVNGKMPVKGLLLAIGAEIVFNATSSLLTLVGWPDWLTVVMLVPAALVAWFDIKHYKDFPKPLDNDERRENKLKRKKKPIEWPSAEDSGYDPSLFEKNKPEQNKDGAEGEKAK